MYFCQCSKYDIEMKILSVSKYKGDTVCIEIEDRSSVYINEKIAGKYNLKAGMNLPESALEEIMSDDLARKAKERALYLLTARDYCFVELYRRLERNYPHEISLGVCKEMAAAGLVDDGKYAEKLARELFEVRRVGMLKTKQEMKRRGLTETSIEAAVEPYADDEDTAERLRELVEIKYARYLTDEKGVKKVRSALVRAGYRYGEINAVLKAYDAGCGGDYDG